MDFLFKFLLYLTSLNPSCRCYRLAGVMQIDFFPHFRTDFGDFFVLSMNVVAPVSDTHTDTQTDIRNLTIEQMELSKYH